MKVALSEMPVGEPLAHPSRDFAKLRSQFSKRPRNEPSITNSKLRDSFSSTDGVTVLTLPDFRTGEIEYYSDSGDAPPPLRQPFRYAHDKTLNDISEAVGLMLLSGEEDELDLAPRNVLHAAHVLASLGNPAESSPTPLHRQKGPDDEQADPEPAASSPAHSTNYLLPPQSAEHAGRHTLVLDLDETLVHSTQSIQEGQHHDWSLTYGDFYCEVEDNGVMEPIYVRVRPGALQFLEYMSSLYEVVLFTAGTARYAETVAAILDPGRTFFHHILAREHCTYVVLGEDGTVEEVPQVSSSDGTFYNLNQSASGDYVKDLSKLGRDLDKVVIVDNNPKCYLFHPRNALGCSTWRNDREDNELRDFGEFLFAVHLAPEVITDLDEFHRRLDELNKAAN